MLFRSIDRRSLGTARLRSSAAGGRVTFAQHAADGCPAGSRADLWCWQSPPILPTPERLSDRCPPPSPPSPPPRPPRMPQSAAASRSAVRRQLDLLCGSSLHSDPYWTDRSQTVFKLTELYLISTDKSLDGPTAWAVPDPHSPALLLPDGGGPESSRSSRVHGDILVSVRSISNMLHAHTHTVSAVVWPPPGAAGVVGARRCPPALRFTRCCLQQAISGIGVAVNQRAGRLAAWP